MAKHHLNLIAIFFIQFFNRPYEQRLKRSTYPWCGISFSLKNRMTKIRFFTNMKYENVINVNGILKDIFPKMTFVIFSIFN